MPKIYYFWISKDNGMVYINEKLDESYRMQKDGILVQDEEQRLRTVAQSYALCENAIAVLSNLRLGISHIYWGHVGESLGLATAGSYQKVDSIWEEDIYFRIHPDDQKLRSLQELSFLHFAVNTHVKNAHSWYMTNTMRMKDSMGKYHFVNHRIFYFAAHDKSGVSYTLCLYTLAPKDDRMAYLVNTHTGERRKLDVESNSLLSEREVSILQLIRNGKASKQIAGILEISKHTVDRHRQNIICKLQVNNTTEACHKAKLLGLID